MTLREFLQLPSVRIVSPDEETSQYYASVHAALRAIGRAIPTNDLWLAAQALQHNVAIYSADSHFEWVEGLRRA